MRRSKHPCALLLVLVPLVLSCNDPERVPNEQIDSTPPAPVTDLTVTDPTDESLRLVWSASGDDGTSGLAHQYEIRVARQPHDSDEWLEVDIAILVDAQADPGAPESAVVAALEKGKSYYFALRTADEVPNWSTWSNTATMSTTNTAPTALFSMVPDTTCFAPVSVDATASHDAEDSAEEIQIRWDWEGDAIWDTPWSFERVVEVPPGTPGASQVTLQVRDQGGLTSQATRLLFREQAVKIRRAYRKFFTEQYRDCCSPHDCLGCWIRHEKETDQLGYWSAAQGGASQESYIGADSIWGSVGSTDYGGEINSMHVWFDVCAEVTIEIPASGCRMRLFSVSGSGVDLSTNDCKNQPIALTLPPGSYELSVSLYQPFRLDFRFP